MGCDLHPRHPLRHRQISIHAPQWGATFISRPSSRSVLFQSTHPSGVRRDPYTCCGHEYISIHAPQWGATPTARERPRRACHFNPRTPVGCDAAWPAMTGSRAHFNPRTPVGCDNTKGGNRDKAQHFNPHAPVGCDNNQQPIRVEVDSFQSTHPSGVRRSIGVNLFLQFDFNPRTPVGCDGGRRHVRTEGHISIHAPQWGATSAVSTPLAILEFQSTHPSGVRIG